MFNGKKLSILGDSVSTYKGASNDYFANSTTYENDYFYSISLLPLCDTYWQIAMNELGLELCVNNSFSGGLLSGRDNPYAGINRAHNLSTDAGDNPDFIIVFMGINDLGWGVDPSLFSADYEHTLKIIKEKYPLAWVCCVNLPDRYESLKVKAIEYNTAIENAVKTVGKRFFIADLFNSPLNNEVYRQNTVGDTLHPNEIGMRMIADTIICSFKENIF